MKHRAEDGPQRDGADRALVSGREEFLNFLAKRLGNRADAEDVLQEFCIRVLARKEQLRDVERMNAWLYSILRSALNDHYRKNGRRQRLGEALTLEAPAEETAPDASQAAMHVCSCAPGRLRELRPADAELIRRIDIEGEDRAPVAAGLGLSMGTLGVRLHRARAALREKLLSYCGCCCQDGFEDCSCPPPADQRLAAHSGEGAVSSNRAISAARV